MPIRYTKTDIIKKIDFDTFAYMSVLLYSQVWNR